MALFRTFRRLFECFTPFWHTWETPKRRQESVKLPVAPSLTKTGKTEVKHRWTRPKTARYGKRTVMERYTGEGDKVEQTRKEVKATDRTPHLVEVKPARPHFLKPLKGKLPDLPSVSGHLLLPAHRLKSLPPVNTPSDCPVTEWLFSQTSSPCQVDPLKLSPVLPLLTVEPEEVLPHSSTPLRLPILVKPVPFTSSRLIVMDPEDEENLHVRSSSEVRPLSPVSPDPPTSSCLTVIDLEDEDECLETIWSCDVFKSHHPRLLEAENKPIKTMAWLEDDSEEEGMEEEKDGRAMGDFEPIQDLLHGVSLKHIHVASPDETLRHKVIVQEEPQSKRQVPLGLILWMEEKAKKKVERKLQKEKERRERELLHHRYRNDPKLKHLWINKHNHYNQICI